MTDRPVKIVEAILSPHHLRMVFTLEGTEDSLQGVVDWAKETWGAANCKPFYHSLRATKKRVRKPCIFRFARAKASLPTWRMTWNVTPSEECYTMDVAVWGKDQSALFKLRWA